MEIIIFLFGLFIVLGPIFAFGVFLMLLTSVIAQGKESEIRQREEESKSATAA